MLILEKQISQNTDFGSTWTNTLISRNLSDFKNCFQGCFQRHSIIESPQFFISGDINVAYNWKTLYWYMKYSIYLIFFFCIISDLGNLCL